MPESIECSVVLPVKAEKLYRAWLDSAAHGDFTGSPAEIDAEVGGKFTAWDGYISGTTLELEPPKRIVQSWRTTEFPPGSPDSRLEIEFQAVKQGTKIVLVHTNIPDGQGADYRQGWTDYYFAPMQEYFGAQDAPGAD